MGRASMFAPYAVYTILHRDKLKRIAKSGKVTSLYEKKRWVTGRELFDEASRQGQAMAILYADANECSTLLYWGRISALDVSSDGTRYTVADLTPLSRKKTQQLVLRSTKKHIADGFIRPYAIVQTPSCIHQHEDSSPGRKARGAGVRGAVHIPGNHEAVQKAGVTTLFSFGYWGCGSATPSLVKAIDEAESAHGFEPPLWVDVGISRSVRAVGFRDRKFEELLKARYEWIPDLGNKRVQEG